MVSELAGLFYADKRAVSGWRIAGNPGNNRFFRALKIASD
jgi:hypothetical protein